MPLIKTKTIIKADIKTCFDLARNIDVHQESLKHTQEISVAGKTTGLIELGEWVSWEAKHFGVVQHLTSKVTKYKAPYYFSCEMVLGVFKLFKHSHTFHELENETVMINVFYFESPYGIVGKVANLVFLKRYMTNLLNKRNRYLKKKAESLIILN